MGQGGGSHCATRRTGPDASIQSEAEEEHISGAPGVKRNLIGSFTHLVRRRSTVLGKGYKRLKSQEIIGNRRGPSLPRGKSKELLMQHDPVGLALKIPLDRTVAAISTCLITCNRLYSLKKNLDSK